MDKRKIDRANKIFFKYYKTTDYNNIVWRAANHIHFDIDVFSLGYMSCWKAALSFNSRHHSNTKFLKYFQHCFYNAIRSELRKLKSRKDFENAIETGEKVCYNVKNEVQDKPNVILDFLDDLQESERKLLIGRFCEEKTLEELGMEFNVSYEAIRKRLKKIIKKVQESDSGSGVVLSDSN